MTKPEKTLIHRRDWVFDLDNTLYPATCNLFAQIDVRMTDFVARYLDLNKSEARAIQKKYYKEHGTTLNGLMNLHGMDPVDFLDFVHDIDHSPLPVCQILQRSLTDLPGRKFVLTNGSSKHADNVLSAMQLEHVFEGVFGIEDMAYQPKPDPRAFDRFIDTFQINPNEAVFFEDLARNLEPASAMGFATVLVESDMDWSHEPEGARPGERGIEPHPFIDHRTDNLTAFLQDVLAKP